MLLVGLGNRARLRTGTVFALYVAGYALGRLWVESLRPDPESLVLGVRVNILVSGIAFASPRPSPSSANDRRGPS